MSDKDGVVERVVAFQEGGPAGKKIVREVCTEFAPVKVCTSVYKTTSILLVRVRWPIC